jgi:hypothetical protein
VLRQPRQGEDVKQLQQKLKDAGFDPGEVDGKFGPKTEAALRAYQAANGLRVDGRAGEETYAALGLEYIGHRSARAPAGAGSGADAAGGAPDASAAPGATPEAGAAEAPSASSTPEAAAAAAGTTQLDVPFVSQWTLSRPRVACFRACKEMLAGVGLKDRGPANALWLHGAEGLGVSASSAQALRAQIDSDLEAGKPVFVGVNRPGGSNQNQDGVTDHWVVVTGKGVDEQGRTYYTFHDPGRRDASAGSDQNPENRFYVDEKTGQLYTEDADGNRRYDVTAVRTSEAA